MTYCLMYERVVQQLGVFDPAGQAGQVQVLVRPGEDVHVQPVRVGVVGQRQSCGVGTPAGACVQP